MPIVPPVLGLAVLALGVGAALPVAAAADESVPGRLIVTDPSGDAGGLNDRGEGVVGDLRGPVSFAEADLTRLAFTALRDDRQSVTGFAVHFSSVGGPQPVSPFSGAEMGYAVVLQPSPECRLSISYTVRGEFPGVGELQAGDGCSTPGLRVPLATMTWGRSVRLDVPYGIGPDALRAGEDLDEFYAYSSDGLVVFDTIYPRERYTLPGGGEARGRSRQNSLPSGSRSTTQLSPA
jgi:hypothetical protein